MTPGEGERSGTRPALTAWTRQGPTRHVIEAGDIFPMFAIRGYLVPAVDLVAGQAREVHQDALPGQVPPKADLSEW